MPTLDSRKHCKRSLRLDELEVTQATDVAATCRVTLSADADHLFVGEGTSLVLGRPRMHAAAKATANAIAAYARVPIAMETCNKTPAGPHLVVVVVVLADLGDGRTRRLTGAVLVTDDEDRAAARAVLDATNRWLDRLESDMAA